MQLGDDDAYLELGVTLWPIQTPTGSLTPGDSLAWLARSLRGSQPVVIRSGVRYRKGSSDSDFVNQRRFMSPSHAAELLRSPSWNT